MDDKGQNILNKLYVHQTFHGKNAVNVLIPNYAFFRHNGRFVVYTQFVDTPILQLPTFPITTGSLVILCTLTKAQLASTSTLSQVSSIKCLSNSDLPTA